MRGQGSGKVKSPETSRNVKQKLTTDFLKG